MNIAIIGSEEKKFTPMTALKAKTAILNTIAPAEWPLIIVSGRCHLGGVDVWAEEEADRLKIPKLIFPPEVRTWDGGTQIGYKQRNIQIAQAADLVVVIVPTGVPLCYHCAKRSSGTPLHVKSGACWTAWYAVEQLHKKAKWIVI